VDRLGNKKCDSNDFELETGDPTGVLVNCSLHDMADDVKLYLDGEASSDEDEETICHFDVVSGGRWRCCPLSTLVLDLEGPCMERRRIFSAISERFFPTTWRSTFDL
jgi:hypothetical protein